MSALKGALVLFLGAQLFGLSPGTAVAFALLAFAVFGFPKLLVGWVARLLA